MLNRIRIFISRLIRIVIALAVVSALIFVLYDYLTDTNRQVSRFDRLHYAVTIEADGSASVLETRTYTFRRGRFTYGWFNLDAAATDIQVTEAGRFYTQLETLPTRRQPDQFVVLPQRQIQRIEWYYAAQGPETRHFQFHYRIPDVALEYADCVVYFQKYFTTTDTADVRRIEVEVNLPRGADAGNTLVWGHGPAHGQISFAEADDSLVLLQVNRIGNSQSVAARFLMPAGSVPQARQVDEARYDRVLAEETAAAAAADRARFLLGLMTGLALLAVLLLILLLVRHYRLQRSAFQRLPAKPVAPDLREIPTKAPLPIVARLFHFYEKKMSQGELISLTILDLIRQNVLQLETVSSDGKEELYLNLRSNEAGQYTVDAYATPVLDFLFRDAAANRSCIAMSELKRYSRSNKNRAACSTLMISFAAELDKAWDQTGYADKSRTRLPAALRDHRLACLVAGGAAFLALNFLDTAVFALPAAILLGGSLAVLLANWILTHKKPYLSQKGENELARWQALAGFLRTFADYKEKDLPEASLWEDLLIYAAALQMAEQVLEQLRLHYPNLDHWTWHNHNYYLLYGRYGYAYGAANQAGGLSGLQTTLSQIMQSAHSVVQSQSSSDGGGGFSGGGSSGGGAGGSSSGGVG